MGLGAQGQTASEPRAQKDARAAETPCPSSQSDIKDSHVDRAGGPAPSEIEVAQKHGIATCMAQISDRIDRMGACVHIDAGVLVKNERVLALSCGQLIAKLAATQVLGPDKLVTALTRGLHTRAREAYRDGWVASL